MSKKCRLILILTALALVIGLASFIGMTRQDKGYANVAYPRHINLREKK